MERKVYRIAKAGNIAKLKLRTEPIATPRPNEVMIEVKSIGLNFADIFALQGLYSATPKGSFIPGLEYSGKVLNVGDKVRTWKVGDQIVGVTRFGGYASHLNINEDYITKLPNDWSFEEGASYLVQGLTAYYGLFRLGNIKEGDTVLIHSAAGGVGLLANRIAKKKKAYTIGTVGSKKKINLLKKEGYDDWIVRNSKFKDDLQNALGERELNIIMECIGGKVLEAGFELLSPQGRLINYGSANYGNSSDVPNWLKLAWTYLTRPKIDPLGMIETNKAILGFNLIWLYHKKNLMKSIIAEMEELNLPAPFVGHTFKFEEIHEALKLFQSGQTTGKVVVNVS